MSKAISGHGTVCRAVTFYEIVDARIEQRANGRKISHATSGKSPICQRWIYVFSFNQLAGRSVFNAEIRADTAGMLSVLSAENCLKAEPIKRDKGAPTGGSSWSLPVERNGWPVLYLFVASPIRLATATIRRICRAELRLGDPGVVVIDDCTITVTDVVNQLTADGAPVPVSLWDPVTLVSRLIPPYHKALENEQAHMGRTGSPEKRNEAEARNLQYTIASIIESVVDPKDEDANASIQRDWTGKRRSSEAFVADFEAKTRYLRKRREATAQQLVSWFNGPELALYEGFYAEAIVAGDAEVYGLWLEWAAFTHQRLEESVAGQAYLSKPGPAMAATIRDYLFPPRANGDTVFLCRKYVDPFVHLWSKFIPWAAQKTTDWLAAPVKRLSRARTMHLANDAVAELAVEHFNKVLGAEVVQVHYKGPNAFFKIADGSVAPEALKKALDDQAKARASLNLVREELSEAKKQADRWQSVIAKLAPGEAAEKFSAALEVLKQAMTVTLAVARMNEYFEKAPESRKRTDQALVAGALVDVARELYFDPAREALEHGKVHSPAGWVGEPPAAKAVTGAAREKLIRRGANTLLVVGILIEGYLTYAETAEMMEEGQKGVAAMRVVQGTASIALTVATYFSILNPAVGLVALGVILGASIILDTQRSKGFKLFLERCSFGIEKGRPGKTSWSSGEFNEWIEGQKGMENQLRALLTLLCRFTVRAYNPVTPVVKLDYFVPGMKLVVDYFWWDRDNDKPSSLQVEIDPETKERSIGFNVELAKDLHRADASRVRFSFGPGSRPRVIWINCDNTWKTAQMPLASWVIVRLKFEGHGATKPIVVPPTLTEQTSDEDYRYGAIPQFAKLVGLFFPLCGGPKGLNNDTKPWLSD